MNELGVLEVAILASLLVLAICAIVSLVALSGLRRRIEASNTGAALVSEFDRALRDLGDRIQRSQTELDQGLRATTAQGMRDGLTAAFKHVQDGNVAQAGELARFGAALGQEFQAVKGEVSMLSEKVAAALVGLTQSLSEKLVNAEVAAAEGRALLLRDTAAAVFQAREQIDRSMAVFGAQQEDRLGRLDRTVGDGASAVQASLDVLRREIAERLDAVSAASSNLLEKSAATFGEIKAAVVASEEKTGAVLAEQRVAVLDRLSAGQLEVSGKLAQDLGGLTQRVSDGLETFSGKLRLEQEHLRGLVGAKLNEMRAGNEAKLEDMRRAVDEKLQGALEKQVGESFKRIAEQFAAVQQAIGQVQTVAGQVGDLKRLFSNVKSRGGWGEAQAEAMLQDMLPAGAYEKNKRLREGSSEFVEFAIRVPLKDEAVRWIPVDSKFPTEDYERLLAANDEGNREDEAAARTGLARRIRLESERIGSKYIVLPHTVEFAVLYLPSDSLFAEVARSPGLLQLVRRDHRIIVMGPSLLPAFLHTINVGYLTMAMERNAAQIGITLGAVKAEWESLLPWLDKLSSRTDTLKNGIETVRRRAKAVGRALKAVDAIDQSQAEAVLGMEGANGYDPDEGESNEDPLAAAQGDPRRSPASPSDE